MKTIKFSLIAIAIIAFSSSLYAQETATATATATIVTPISITKTVDINFGTVAVQSTTGGTVVLSVGGVRSKTGGVTLPAVTGTVTAASFDIAGEPNYTYAITLPSSALTISSSSNSMTVTTFVSNPAVTGQLTAGGTQTLKVGATLNVAAAQPSGVYVNPAGFNVTVNYN